MNDNELSEMIGEVDAMLRKRSPNLRRASRASETPGHGVGSELACSAAM